MPSASDWTVRRGDRQSAITSQEAESLRKVGQDSLPLGRPWFVEGEESQSAASRVLQFASRPFPGAGGACVGRAGQANATKRPSRLMSAPPGNDSMPLFPSPSTPGGPTLTRSIVSVLRSQARPDVRAQSRAARVRLRDLKRAFRARARRLQRGVSANLPGKPSRPHRRRRRASLIVSGFGRIPLVDHRKIVLVY
jgi:hypothetical protein